MGACLGKPRRAFRLCAIFDKIVVECYTSYIKDAKGCPLLFGVSNMNDSCIECGLPATEAHHVIPKSLGGTATVPLCGVCHDRVHSGGWKRRDNHKELTIAGLKRAKENGIVLGNPTNLGEAGKKGAATTRAKAVAFAESLRDTVVRVVKAVGSLTKAAVVLNEMRVKTARGGKWSTQSLSNLMKTLQIDVVQLRKHGYNTHI